MSTHDSLDVEVKDNVAQVTLIGPGKALTAWARAPAAAGCYLWRDGPQPMFAGGTWGQLKVGDAPETFRPDAYAP